MADQDPRFASLLDDLAAEHAALDAVVAPLVAGEWDRPTPAAGWAVRDQVGHLQYFDQQAVLSAADPEAFVAGRERVLADLEGFEATTLTAARLATPDHLVDSWRAGRIYLLDTFRRLRGDERLEWYGPPMNAMSFVTARLMETWAHGQDVVDAVDAGNRWPASDRLRHIAHLGVRTRRFSYALRGLEAPEVEVRVELAAPSGDRWAWGPEHAANFVGGPALDFCLLVTQRRHRDDVSLKVTGTAAEEWLTIAQAFAGGVGSGRPPLKAR